MAKMQKMRSSRVLPDTLPNPTVVRELQVKYRAAMYASI
jgi:hypothetical protein